MSDAKGRFPLSVDRRSMIEMLKDNLYENPLTFLRENVQNAVDAVRMRTHKEGGPPEESRPLIEITVENNTVSVRDRGIGMSLDDLKKHYWVVGASGKRTKEAREAGCIGKFGIGGFANFGPCARLEVTSQALGSSVGTKAWLLASELEKESRDLPDVNFATSDGAAPNGTIVTGELRDTPNTPSVKDLRDYICGFVQHVPFPISFNQEIIPRKKMEYIEDTKNYRQMSDCPSKWQSGPLEISGAFWADKKDTLAVVLSALTINGRPCKILGHLRFEAGSVEIFHSGFKICAATPPNWIGVSGKIDCTEFSPTAGRDILNGETSSMLAEMSRVLEDAAVRLVLNNPSMIPRNTRIFEYVVHNNLIDLLGDVEVDLAHAGSMSLKDISDRQVEGDEIYYTSTGGNNLTQIMRARGHIVVTLSRDGFRAEAERLYLEEKCQAKSLAGMIECGVPYEKLSPFEMAVVSELSDFVHRTYEIKGMQVIPGKLSEDIPVYVTDRKGTDKACVYVDVRHQKIMEIESLADKPSLFSVMRMFFQTYLGDTLKKWSPLFTGSGVLKIGLLAGKRSNIWVLTESEIGVLGPSQHHQIIKASDVHTIDESSPSESAETRPDSQPPKLLRIIDSDPPNQQVRHYIRLLGSAFYIYGDILNRHSVLGVVWAGNHIVYVASDGTSASFNYDIRLDRVVSVSSDDGSPKQIGANEITVPLVRHYGNVYFPIPTCLEEFLVPRGQDEVRIELQCDWSDPPIEKDGLSGCRT